MVREFPDEAQRRAVCERQWEQGETNMLKKVKGQASNRLARLRGSDGEYINLWARAENDNEVDLYLYDVIGFPFIEAQDLLYQVPQNAKTIRVHINSPGGDVFEGMAIYNFLSSHKADVNVTVDSLAASSASLVAMSGARVSMARASFMMIHQPWTMLMGDAEELRKEAELLDKISDIFASAYSERSGKSKKDILELMRAETWFTPDEALESKLADEIQDGGSIEARAAFDLSIFENVPQALKQPRGSASRQARTPNRTEDVMNRKLRALLERLGLPEDATEEQAWAFWEKVDVSQLNSADQHTIQSGQGGGAAPQDPGQTAKEAAQAEKRRIADIRDSVRIAGLDDSLAEEMINEDYSLEQARERIFNKMKETNPPVGAGRISAGQDERDKLRRAMSDGLCMRAGLRVEEPAAGAREFRAATMQHCIIECLSRAGEDTRNLRSPKQIAQAYLKYARRAELSTDDFGSIMLDVQNKTLQQAYSEAPRTFLPLRNVVGASDFKEQYGVALSEAPDLDMLSEHEEYKSADFKDKQESYKVKKYGKIVYLTLEMIVNDDLRAFTRVPQLFGAAAARKESDVVWSLIINNPVMNEDGKALFHADHNNYETSDVGPVTSDRLAAGRAMMRKQTGMQGAKLNLMPRFVIVPAAQETDAEILIRSATLPEDQKPSGTYNWAQNLVPIAEARLDDDSTNAWYLAASPNQIDMIEMAYLDGEEEPYTEDETEFERDAVGYKVRHIFGAGVMDFRGLFKNAGA